VEHLFHSEKTLSQYTLTDMHGVVMPHVVAAAVAVWKSCWPAITVSAAAIIVKTVLEYRSIIFRLLALELKKQEPKKSTIGGMKVMA
jgi:hypothetical protein